MSGFTVEWLPGADDEFIQLWHRATDRLALTTAEARANNLLADDPLGNGRHLSEGLYLLDVPPLRVYYTIDLTFRNVKVTSCLLFP